ncbi:MAG: hypothetical protein GXO89_17330, partial [Chlorobi bacterium]|nr:hypothetical protein [Chlorobiota bacterium]
MQAILIKRVLRNDELADVEKRYSSGEYDIFTSGDNFLPREIKFTVCSVSLEPEQKKEINYRIFRTVISFGDKLVNGKSVKDWLKVDNTSIWYYHKFRIYFLLRNLFYEIEEIRQISKRYSNVLVYTNNSILKFYKGFNNNVRMEYSGKSAKSLSGLQVVVTYPLFFVSRVIISFFQISKLKRKPHLIIDRIDNHHPIIDISTKKCVIENSYLGYLYSHNDESLGILDEVEIPKFGAKASFSIRKRHFFLKRNLPRLFCEYILFRGLTSRDSLSSFRRLNNKVMHAYSVL